MLFSPVKESHISVDSLDLDGYPDDGDIILTCQANKNNYTIAFEGSTVYSDDSSFYGKLATQSTLEDLNFNRVSLHFRQSRDGKIKTKLNQYDVYR